MVKTTNAALPILNGNISVDDWLTEISERFSQDIMTDIRHACNLAHIYQNSEQNYLGRALEIANRLLHMDVDHETIIASIAYHAVCFADLNQNEIEEHFNKRIAKLVHGVMQMDATNIFQNQTSSQQQISMVREMLLTMVEDIRVVLIKLAERCYIMQHVEFADNHQQQQAAHETQLIYAPLASRLGINDLKWELEDLAFRYLHRDTYKNLAKQVNEKRIVREQYVADFMTKLSKLLDAENIKHDISGRAKHIYSIYKKIQRKQVDYNEIYDATAVRILVKNIEDCYKTLSIVHSQWEHVSEEFDDYVATPKPNGYQSIHTVAIGPGNKHIEIQIRTQKMHEENELGAAAHWLYKEGATQSAYDRKIAWLRELLAWKKEVTDASELPTYLKENLTADRVFVFTPNGDLVSLPIGATPLDFAYHVHSEIGHRCKGARINDRIVPLTQTLKTGDRVDIITHKHPQPSRDWLSPHNGYLVSSRARAKIQNWFKRQEHESFFATGQSMLQKELKKHHYQDLDLNRIAKRLHLKSADNMILAIGSGELKVAEVIEHIEQDTQKTQTEKPIIIRSTKIDINKTTGISVQGVEDLVTHIAGCCKPLPGDDIVGYVTQEHGVTIHRRDCDNVIRQMQNNENRIFDVSWGEKQQTSYPVDISIEALDRNDLLHDITMIFSQAKIHLLDLHTKNDPKKHFTKIYVKIALQDIHDLTQTMNQLRQLANVYAVIRL
jgi:GTP pyrophosphokinase